MNVALKKAYDLERKGLEYYIDSASSSNNALVKQTLFSLAKEEVSHMMKISEISSSLDASGDWSAEETRFGYSDIEVEIKRYFEKTDKGMLDAHKDNADVIKKAMEFERKSYELYDDLSKKAGSDIEKRFYAELKKQEESHFDALQNVYYYLTKTGDWFEKDERNVWNWMNI